MHAPLVGEPRPTSLNESSISNEHEQAPNSVDIRRLDFSNALPLAGTLLCLDVGVRGLPEPRYLLHGDASSHTKIRENFQTMSFITLAAVEAFAYRVPLKLSIKVAFGTFPDRPMVPVKVRFAKGGRALKLKTGFRHDLGAAISGDVLQVNQPDVTKLGGITGDGLLEFDCHLNVGREAVVGTLFPDTNGCVPMPQGAGLGAAPDLAALRRLRTRLQG